MKNRFDDRLDNILYDVDIIRFGLVVPNPHESPRMLLKVPPRLDDPVIILFSCSLHPVDKVLRVRIVLHVL